MKDNVIEKFLNEKLLDGSVKVKADIPGVTKSYMLLKDVLEQFYTSLYSGDVSKKEALENMLEDVVNELDLSDGMIEKHGQEGTPPAELVRLVLEQKDQQITMLKAGMKQLNNE